MQIELYLYTSSNKTHLYFRLQYSILKHKPWGQLNKPFFLHMLRMGQISYSVCPWQTFPVQFNFCA